MCDSDWGALSAELKTTKIDDNTITVIDSDEKPANIDSEAARPLEVLEFVPEAEERLEDMPRERLLRGFE